MKKLKLLLIGLALALPVTMHAATIVGSPHDLRGWDYGSGSLSETNQVCIFCHTPHNAQSTQVIPLWNHLATTNTTFTMYTSSTMVGTPSASRPIGGESKVCMACHDGSVAVDAFGGTSGTAAARVSGDLKVGPNMSDDHPISFAYPSTDSEIVAKATVVAAGLPMFNGGNDMECATCHDVHNTATAVGANALLRVNNNGSALCTTCHSK